jgi:hypothetical protein
MRPIVETIGRFRRLLRRFKNRLKPLFRLRELWRWEFESCERCGACFKLAYTLRDGAWNALYGSDNGCLCLNCAAEKALDQKLLITPRDFEYLSLFYGDAGNFSIIPQIEYIMEFLNGVPVSLVDWDPEQHGERWKAEEEGA